MGELARKSGCPSFAKTPQELLIARTSEDVSPTDKYFWPIFAGATGVGTVAIFNMFHRRPKWAGIHLHLFFGAIATGLGILMRDTISASKAESDAALKHYVSLHPDDFPPYEKKRWADVYLPFQPIR